MGCRTDLYYNYMNYLNSYQTYPFYIINKGFS